MKKLFRVLINSKFGETSPNLVEKLQFINGIDDICGVAQKVPSLESPEKLLAMLDDIISRKHGKQ